MVFCPEVFNRTVISPANPAGMRFDVLFPPFSTNLDSIDFLTKSLLPFQGTGRPVVLPYKGSDPVSRESQCEPLPSLASHR